MKTEFSSLLKGEWIGLDILISEKGLSGKIIDETRHTFVIRAKGSKTRIMKKDHTFEVGSRKIPGKLLLGRSFDRIKK